MFDHYLMRKRATRWISCLGLFLVVFSIIVVTGHLSWSLPLESKEPSDRQELISVVNHLEQMWKNDYTDYFQSGTRNQSALQAPEIAEFLARKEKETGKTPALLYLHPMPEGLNLLLMTAQGHLTHHQIQDASQPKLGEIADEFRSTITNPRYIRTTRYQASAQQLYEWIIRPIEAQLETEGIDTLLLCTGVGLRSVPFAALFDGEQFLVEKYNLAMIPAFNLMTVGAEKPQQSKLLAMGASEFKNLNPLPAVALELELLREGIVQGQNVWESRAFLNEEFTLENLQTQLESQDFDIVHLATHAEFQPGKPNQSYIQFWDTQLTLDRIRQLPLDDPPLDLLVLSACRTAIGDPEAELGFAGLAFESGVQSALASLWYVSDGGTLALMSEFYQQLPRVSMKAEALRQAQISLLRGEVSLNNRELRGSRGAVELPSELSNLAIDNLAAPFYWAAFTLIGSPW
ncbi:CHAT domain-containing protein [Roseofilum capinflatum]|uniref:CHAT domain-containing protein n=1 Tax=Roseofilum capinflatum BLCC-M114 TaxID=3022440 RepID=A0ABT7B4W9_9CYAN|nr:CHAT domain-containing protein [Roseofilum capinflatum]MDJ1173571.1 CHAT domain-containing protein [Roseofilum capinflatum BLCC-M114]